MCSVLQEPLAGFEVSTVSSHLWRCRCSCGKQRTRPGGENGAVADETGVGFRPAYLPFFSVGEEGTFEVATPEEYLSGLG